MQNKQSPCTNQKTDMRRKCDDDPFLSLSRYSALNGIDDEDDDTPSPSLPESKQDHDDGSA